MSFEIVFPENEGRFIDREFNSVKSCRSLISKMNSIWKEIDAKGNDFAAFMNHVTGVIIVIREVKNE